MAGDAEARCPRILGLTGAIGCGKTTVGDILLGLGALERIDADSVVHELMTPGTDVTAAIAETFGPGVVRADGAVDRSALADMVFSDTAALQALERITHPAVRAAIRQRLAQFKGQPGVIVVDAVKLLQGDLLTLCDAVWVIQCPPEEQLRRLTGIRRMRPEAAAARVAAQPSFEHPRVVRIVENAGGRDELERQVTAGWNEIMHLDSAL